MSSMAYVFLLFIGLAASQSLDDCPPGITRDQYLVRYRDLCLEFVVWQEKEYFSAEDDCEIRGGKLIMVKDKEISDFIIDKLIFDYQFNDRLWIGLNDYDDEGYWKWVDGTPLDLNGYTNFADDNFQNSLEDCAVLDPNRNGEWHDYHCENEFFGLLTYEFPYICQYNARESSGVSTTSEGTRSTTVEGTVPTSTTTTTAQVTVEK